MENLTGKTSFNVNRKLTLEEINKCTYILTPIEGKTDLEMNDKMISVNYNPFKRYSQLP
jgi:hypothetical protein